MKLTFEEGMTRLAQITAQLEAGDLPLDESIKLYEEATRIIAQCDDLLKKAKLKISVIEQAQRADEETDDEDKRETEE